MAARARGRGSGHGIDSAILETRVGSAGKVLEAVMREARRCQAEIRKVASGTGRVKSWTAGTQEGFRRCRTPGEATGGPGIDSEFCARCRATSMADGNAQEVPVEACSDPFAEPIRSSARRSPYQVVQLCLGPAGLQCSSDVKGPCRR